MLRRHLPGILSICLLLFFGEVPAARASGPVAEIIAAAKQHGCEIMQEYDFIRGALSDSGQESYAFWCRLPQTTSFPNFTDEALVTTEGHECPKIIEGQNAGKLSLREGKQAWAYHDKPLELSSFYVYGNRGEKGPADEFTSHNVIYSDIDGLASYYYCYRGRWLILEVD